MTKDSTGKLVFKADDFVSWHNEQSPPDKDALRILVAEEANSIHDEWLESEKKNAVKVYRCNHLDYWYQDDEGDCEEPTHRALIFNSTVEEL